MITALKLIQTARAAGIRFVSDGGKLKLKFSQRPAPELVEELRQHKPEILALLKPDVLTAELAPWDENAEERAAVIEFDGQAPRAWAEALARLDPSRPPLDVPERRWVTFLDDCGRFLNQWATHAVEYGWSPLELFGADRAAPYARIFRAGLLWIVEGRDIIKLECDKAVIIGGGGFCLTFYRSNFDHGGIPIWEIAR